MPPPTYLAKNRHGGFLFRIKIPLTLRPLLAGKTVITKSLGTHHRPTALKLARRLAAQTECEFEAIQMTKEKYLREKVIAKGRLTVNRAQLEKLRSDLNSTDTAAQERAVATGEALLTERAALGTRLTLAEKKIALATEIEKHLQEQILRAQVEGDYGISRIPAQTTTSGNAAEYPTLAEAMVMYIRAKEIEGTANKAHPEKAIHKGSAGSPYRGYTASFRLLLAAAGNIQTIAMDVKDVNKFKELVGQMKNANCREVKPLLKFDYHSHKFVKPLPDILKELAAIETTKLAQKTIREYYAEVSTFLGWLGLENAYLHLENCQRMQRTLTPQKIPKGADHAKETNRKTFTPDQLVKLLAHPTISPIAPYRKTTKRKIFSPADFWIPLLALFTGARGRELAQLFTNDIQEVDGVWCLCISPEEDSGEKKVKTETSKRRTPIHQRLIDIGILKFHNEQQSAGYKYLFPKLWETEIGKVNPYKNWGQSFRRTVIKQYLGIEPGNGEVFHSFRGTLITELQRKGVPEDTRKQLVGHSRGSDAHARYAKGATLKGLQEAINQAAYDEIDFSSITWERFKTLRLTKPETK